MRKHNFTVLIERDEDGMYVAEVPYLKGCYAQGKTIEEALRNVKEVASLCLETQKDIPKREFVAVQHVEITG